MKRALQRFPLLVSFDGAGELVGVTIFKPMAEKTRHAGDELKLPHEKPRPQRKAPR